jgi:hypothetical protein
MTITSKTAALCRKVRHLFEAAHQLSLASEYDMTLRLEKMAHTLWRESGETDMSTFLLWNHVNDIVLGVEAGMIVAK